jgi:4'-phosphopantetheinyl transferase EntD
MSSEFEEDKNPAGISLILAELFPPQARVAELRGPGDPALLYPEETAHFKHAAVSRMQEFAAGRLCARRVLADFGVVNFPLKSQADRQPLWPANLVGSITHTAGFCAAVAAQKHHIAALGIDSEESGRVKQELWKSICTPDEISWLKSLPQSQQQIAATLIFAAKESFYKCQYPLTGERLKFHDARVAIPDWKDARGIVSVIATRRIAFERHAPAAMPCRYLFHHGFITAGMAVPAQ